MQILITVNVISGIIAGIISGGMVYWYSREVNKKRDINEFAHQTLDHLDRAMSELIQGSEGKSVYNLKKIVNKSIRSHFDGKIVDGTKECLELHEGIAKGNTILSCIENIIDNAQESVEGVIDEASQGELFHKRGPLSNAIVALHNSRVEFNSARKKWERNFTNTVFIVISVLALLLIYFEFIFNIIKLVVNIVF